MNKLLFFVLAISSFSSAQPVPVPAIPFNPKTYVCHYTSTPITIDGRLNDSAWTNAEWTEDFVDIEGSLKPLPRFRTRVKMLWDSTYFYIAAEVQEPDVWATLTHRDDIIFYDNDFEVFIDPDGDTHQYSEMEMNALNTVWDLLLITPYRDKNKAPIHDWDMKGLTTGVAVHGTLNNPADRDTGWSVEIAYPWSGFRQLADVSLPPHDGDQWRINFSRVEWKTEVENGKHQKTINPQTGTSYPEDNWVWSPQGVIDMHYPEMWGYVQFSAAPAANLTPFVEHPVEQAKWLLRQIYYGERNYQAQKGSFTENIQQLNLALRPVPEFSFPPMIKTTPSLFEAWVHSNNGTTTVHIRQDGLVWSEKKR